MAVVGGATTVENMVSVTAEDMVSVTVEGAAVVSTKSDVKLIEIRCLR